MPITTIKMLLQKSDRGKVLSLNIAHAQKNSHIEEAVLSELAESIIKNLVLESKIIFEVAKSLNIELDTNLPIEELNKRLLFILDEHLNNEDFYDEIILSMGETITNSVENRNKFLFNRKQINPCKKRMVSCVMDARVFLYMLDFETQNEFVDEFKTLIEHSNSLSIQDKKKQQRHLLRLIEELSKNPQDYLKPEAKFWKSYQTYIWLTDTKEIKKINKAISEKQRNVFGHIYANTVRDKLGLVHHKCDTLLVEFFTPYKYLENEEKGIPTFIEANNHSRFKAFVDGKEDESCGRTVDLGLVQKFNRADDRLDGLPEFVLKIERIYDLTGWKFRVIGFTSTHPENVPLDDKDGTIKKRADAHFSEVLTNRYAIL